MAKKKEQTPGNGMNRRDFLASVGKASVATTIAGNLVSFPAKLAAAPIQKNKPMIWANLLHLSMNMWEDRIAPGREIRDYKPYLQFHEGLWNELLVKMKQVGMNMVVIDLGDAIQYKSHPEIAVKNAWSSDKLRKELAKIRKMGMEPIPKLNFSTAHDTWLGVYHRCVSTPKYYDVCKDLVAEVIELFDKPRFFHLGYDEETAEHQRDYNFTVVRKYDLWWHDFFFFVDLVQKHGVRPWIWSDYNWKHPEEFLEKMPKSVLQSNWYYGTEFGKYGSFKENEKNLQRYIETYIELEKHGYDQIPTASNHSNSENFGMTVEFCSKHIDPKRLLGFIQTPWRATQLIYRQHHIQAIEQVEAVIGNSAQPS